MRRTISHIVFYPLYVKKSQEFSSYEENQQSWWKSWQRWEESMFTGIIQNTSSPDLRSKMEKQKVLYFSLSTTYYKRPDRTLSVVSAEVRTLFKRPMASWMGYPSRYEGSPPRVSSIWQLRLLCPLKKSQSLAHKSSASLKSQWSTTFC